MEVPGLQDAFDTALAKYLLQQGARIRELEDAVCSESTAVFTQLRDHVMAQVSASSGLSSMIDELFTRSEVTFGLVEWLPGHSQHRTRKLVEELHEDIGQANGNQARTTLNRLLPLYMEALGVRQLLGLRGGAVAASPGGKNSDKQQYKLLGYLINDQIRRYLEALQMKYAECGAGAGDETYRTDKSAGLRAASRRLLAALFAFLNIGNFASHNRGQLRYCQQLELCAAVGAMAETLPVIYQAFQDIQSIDLRNRTPVVNLEKDDGGIPADVSISDTDDLEPTQPFTLLLTLPSDTATVLVENETEQENENQVTQEVTFCGADADSVKQPPTEPEAPFTKLSSPSLIDIAAYYKEHLINCPSKTQAKYEATLVHMELVPKTRVCVRGYECCNGPDSGPCAESHSILEALSYNPLVLTLKCPVPESCKRDFVHEHKLCLFNHGEYKGPGSFRWGKRSLCPAKVICTDFNCVKAHSLAEVCWFNPYFRTIDCTQGRACPWRRNCSGFHEEYHASRRSANKNEYLGVAEKVLFIERTIAALRKDPSELSKPSSALSRLLQYYYKQLQKQTHLSSSDRAKIKNVLSHMQLVPKARMCTDEDHFKNDTEPNNCGECIEAHTVDEALSFNPFAMVLACPSPKNHRDDFIHQNGLCIFFHGDKAIPKDFLKAKRLLCEDGEVCVDHNCRKSHSLTEVCWYFPDFRIGKCPQGDECKRQKNCSYYHSNHHEQRDQEMNTVVGANKVAVLVERAYSELQMITTEVVLSPTLVGDGESFDAGSCEESQNATTLVPDGSGISSRPAKCGMLCFEQAISNLPAHERTKYIDVLEYMKLTPKARICIYGENCARRTGEIDPDDGSICPESHSRLEAFKVNERARLLKCPLYSAGHHDSHDQFLCVFAHGVGDIREKLSSGNLRVDNAAVAASVRDSHEDPAQLKDVVGRESCLLS